MGYSARSLSRDSDGVRSTCAAGWVAAEVGNTFGGAVVLAGGVWALFNLDSDEPKKAPPAAKKEEDESE